MSTALHRLHRLRWIAPVAVLALAAVLRLWALDRPDSLVFDELYYVRDAISQLAHGFTTSWPDDDPAFTNSGSFSDRPNSIAHPPLGKWLIGLGILLFSPDSGWGWRIAAALAGIATVGLTMRLGWLMSRSMWIACLAGLLLAVDGVNVVLSRVSLLDIFLTLLVLLGALFVWRDQASPPPRLRNSGVGRIAWRRPWLLAAGLAFGAAAAVKWSGLYALAGFLVLITLRDWWLRRRARVRHPLAGAGLQALVTAGVALPAAFAAYLASWAGWIASPGAQERSPGEAWWVSLIRWHGDALSWHTGLSAPHPYQAHPLSWPLALRPTAMYEVSWGPDEGCRWASGCVAVISPLPNPLVTWGGVLALVLLLWAMLWTVLRAGRMAALRGRWIAAARAGRSAPVGSLDVPGSRLAASPLAAPALWAAAFVLTGYLSGWLPWVLTFSRSAVFQFYAVVLTPFAALALALVLGAVAGLPPTPAPHCAVRRGTRIALPQRPAERFASLSARQDARAASRPSVLELAGIRLDPSPDSVRGRRMAVAIFAIAVLVLGVLFFPAWSGMPTAEWFWRLHVWLPGWD